METTRPEIWIFRPAKRRTGSPSEKMIVSKCRETSPPRDSGFSYWREGVLAHFRKDDYFQVLEKQPGGVGFFLPAKRRTSSFSDKRIIPKCREKEPEDLGFICPALRTKVSAPVCFPRPPRTRRKPRCDRIRDPLRDGTLFAAPTDSRVRCGVYERPGQSA